MELVPIIYQVLLYISVLLFFVISVSYILSKLKKASVVEAGENSQVIRRSAQTQHIYKRPVVVRQSSHFITRNDQKGIAPAERNRNPKIKVIKRSSTYKSKPVNIDITKKKTYQPTITRISGTNGFKSRYMILNNENGNEPGKDLKQTIDSYYQPEKRYANFK